MQDKQLNSTESIELIQRMINATRNKFERGGGLIFLIWGYTSLLVTIAVTVLFKLTLNPNVLWLWWLIPIIGYPTMVLKLRNRPKPVRTYIDKFISYIWITIGSAAILIPTAGMFNASANAAIIPLEALVCSIGVVLTGLTINFRPVTIGGAIAMALSLLMFYTSYYNYIFMAILIVAMIIPGHILNYRGQCLKS